MLDGGVAATRGSARRRQLKYSRRLYVYAWTAAGVETIRPPLHAVSVPTVRGRATEAMGRAGGGESKFSYAYLAQRTVAFRVHACVRYYGCSYSCTPSYTPLEAVCEINSGSRCGGVGICLRCLPAAWCVLLPDHTSPPSIRDDAATRAQ